MAKTHHEDRTNWPVTLTWSEDRIDRMFRDMFRDAFAGGAVLDRLSSTFAAPMHIEEFVADGAFVVRAELPGIDPDKDVEVEVSEGQLTISAHREERSETDRPDAYRSEFRYGSFQRVVRLPQSASTEGATATYTDGVLEIRVPMAAVAASPTRLPITHG